jgi:hypothetical protein
MIKIFALYLILFTSSSFACWKIDGMMKIFDQKIPVSQKFNHGQSYSFMKGPYIVHIEVKDMIHYEVVRKDSITLTPIEQGTFPIDNKVATLAGKNLNFTFTVEHI